MHQAKTIIFALLFTSLVGCSQSMKKVLHDNFTDYTVGKSVPQLSLPKGVELPAKDNYYSIPDVPVKENTKKVSLYPPGSRLMQQKSNSKTQ